MVSKGLKVKLGFPCGSEYIVPVRLIIGGNDNASVTYILMTSNCHHVNDLQRVDTSSVATWLGGNLIAKSCRACLMRPVGR